MRISHIVAIVALLMATPAFAGSVKVENGQTVWTSTQCTAPAVPAAVLQASKDSDANDINVLVSQYNIYVKAAQIYMNCLSDEAGKDADLAAATVAGAGKQNIEAYNASVIALSPIKPEAAKQ